MRTYIVAVLKLKRMVYKFTSLRAPSIQPNVHFIDIALLPCRTIHYDSTREHSRTALCVARMAPMLHASNGNLNVVGMILIVCECHQHDMRTRTNCSNSASHTNNAKCLLCVIVMDNMLNCFWGLFSALFHGVESECS